MALVLKIRASIPVPLACKASALPFELHPHNLELSRKLLFQSANKRLWIFWEGISCIVFQNSVVFWRKLIKYSMCLTLEMRGIAPRTSGLISGRSTIWPTSHVYQMSRNFFSLSQQLWSFSFRSQKIYLLGISICKRLSGDSDYHLMSGSCFGDAGHRSPYFWLDKWALYHLTYIPCSSNLAEFFFAQSATMKFFLRSQKIYLIGISICNRLSGDSDYLFDKWL